VRRCAGQEGSRKATLKGRSLRSAKRGMVEKEAVVSMRVEKGGGGDAAHSSLRKGKKIEHLQGEGNAKGTKRGWEGGLTCFDQKRGDLPGKKKRKGKESNIDTSSPRTK